MTATRGWGWWAHLRAGGTTPWSAWSEAGDPGPGRLPGAANLEVLRRLNELGRPRPELVERILASGLSGRGRGDLPLLGERGVLSAEAVDPGALDAAELLRVPTLLLADRLRAESLSQPEPVRRRWLAAPYVLAGDPWATLTPRAALFAAGRPEGGRRVTAYVVVRPLEQMLTHTWQRRAFGVGVAGWRPWVAGYARRDALPPAADAVAAAARWTAELGREHVHLVTDPSLLPALLRAKGLPGSILVSDSAALAGAAPGRYRTPLGGEVVVEADGRLALAGTGYLAGAGRALDECVAWLVAHTPFGIEDALRLAGANPARLLGETDRGRVAVGARADLAVFVRGGPQDQWTLDTVISAGQPVRAGVVVERAR